MGKGFSPPSFYVPTFDSRNSTRGKKEKRRSLVRWCLLALQKNLERSLKKL